MSTENTEASRHCTLTPYEWETLLALADTLWQLYYRVSGEDSRMISAYTSDHLGKAFRGVVGQMVGPDDDMIAGIEQYMSDNGYDGKIIDAVGWVLWDAADMINCQHNDANAPTDWPGYTDEYRPITTFEAKVADEVDCPVVRYMPEGRLGTVVDVDTDAARASVYAPSILVRFTDGGSLLRLPRHALAPTRDLQDETTRRLIKRQRDSK